MFLRWCAAIGFAACIVAGCAGTPSRPPIPMDADAIAVRPQASPEPQAAVSTTTAEDPAAIEDMIRSEVLQWQGTPHRLGGTDRHGIDCSGFVQRLYRDLFDRQIPRSTALQSKSGRWIGKEQLCTGDLVFFKDPYKGRHVGIYLGEMEFAHASTSRGVTISSLEEVHWRQSYWTARRYLDRAN